MLTLLALLFGVGGRGELACRFSGFGEPRIPPIELDDEACLECCAVGGGGREGGAGGSMVVVVPELATDRGIDEFVELTRELLIFILLLLFVFSATRSAMPAEVDVEDRIEVVTAADEAAAVVAIVCALTSTFTIIIG